MYKLVVIASLLAVASAGLIGAPLGYAGLNGYGLGAPLGYAGAALPLGYAGAPLAYAAAPLAAPAIVAAPVAHAYALPPVREIAEAPIVEVAHEKVEQHGYSIRY